ncbi:alternative ribosome rescue aminoacyl-tRNA hydrolase ArfB [Mesonia sp. MT50]|uniref:Alternative ribosome rescue aminoacyl-tRNA hydrolase ArfB n=1 Tax=Mesonia profundi TaxID=3070998 RepID=A0ABU0ZXU0_9FLAO|nr:alternative ribosome rescue aminoacyl-tRNA hydrolase ArfB [Mesonia profundi]MDQ7916277.1 alternative ribosome rescue aminoacyl-tRNA hydrolase ArfB [Mesonia profundi]
MFSKEELVKEVDFKAVLSGGPGGQHANKTSTKVVLSWSLENTQLFTEEEKERLQDKLSAKLTKEQVLQLSSDHSRSQHKNKEVVIKKFLKLIEQGLHIPRKRKKTKPSKASKKKRLENKKRKSQLKVNRKKPKL